MKNTSFCVYLIEVFVTKVHQHVWQQDLFVKWVKQCVHFERWLNFIRHQGKPELYICDTHDFPPFNIFQRNQTIRNPTIKKKSVLSVLCTFQYHLKYSYKNYTLLITDRCICLLLKVMFTLKASQHEEL